MSCEQWKDYHWGDLITLEYGKGLKNYRDGMDGVPVYGTNGLIGYTSKALCKHNGIIIGRKGAYRGVQYSSVPFYVIDTAFYVEIKKSSLVDYKWAYYQISTYNINSMDSGSAIPSTSREDFYNLSVKLPPIAEQRAIIATLSCLDDKIELNNRINSHLGQMSMTIFSNFVMTTNGSAKKLKDICAFQEGYVNPSQGHAEYFGGSIKWLRAVDINESFIFDTSRTLTDCGFKSAGKSAVLFKPNTIAISKSGTIGRLGLVADFMCGNRAVINIAPNDTHVLPFIYLYLKSRQEEYPNLAVGSVQKNLYVPILQELDIVVPEYDKLLKFCNLVTPLFELWKSNVAENRRLFALRDALLPRLISGAIPVPMEE